MTRAIKIAEPLRPFSHIPGTSSLLPGSSFRLQLFPALIRVHDLSGAAPLFVSELALNVKGPVKDFTLELDLEKGSVKVLGKTQDGFMRYRIAKLANEQGIGIVLEKAPTEDLFSNGNNFWKIVKDSQDPISLYQPPYTERLSLGCHKSQDWDMVLRRGDLSEIFPFWLKLGLLFPQSEAGVHAGTAEMLCRCAEAINSGKAENILQPFKNVFAAGFEGILSPRLHDEQHQGFNLKPIENPNANSLILLSEGALLIRSLFIKESENKVDILPALPKEFHSGRLVNCKHNGTIDMEWSKKLIRRMIYKPDKDCEIAFEFQKALKKFRIRERQTDKGQFIHCGSKIKFSKGHVYFFDNFQK